MDLIYRNLRSRALPIGVILLAFTFSAPLGATENESIASAKSLGKAFASIVGKASPAVVSVVCEKEGRRESMGRYSIPEDHPFFEEFERYFGSPRDRSRVPRTQRTQGSGFIISADGYMLTNNHVVGGAKNDTIEVTLASGKKLKAKVVGTDPGSDVAVAKIDRDEPFPFIKLANSDELEVGEWVVAIGNSFGLSHTVTAGIVSAKGRDSLDLGREFSFQNFIQTDAAINPGNSGGPLLNLDGEAVGMNTALAGPSGASAGIGFAIPINMAEGISEQLIATGTVKRGFLGIRMNPLSEEVASFLDLPDTRGALVFSVVDDTPADRAGLKRYDVIVELNGKPVDSMDNFRNRVAMIAPETKVELTFIRNGKRRTVSAVLGVLPDSRVAMERIENPTVAELGLKVGDVTPDIREALGDEDIQGVIIEEVAPDSDAADKRLRPGMVITEINRTRVQNRKEFHELIQDAIEQGKKVILLIVKDGSGERMVALKLPEGP
jgi:serine protease Do